MKFCFAVKKILFTLLFIPCEMKCNFFLGVVRVKQPIKICKQTSVRYRAYILKRGTSGNKLEPPAISWSQMEQAGTTLNKLEPPGTRWTQQQNDTKNKKFIGKNCAYNTIAQLNITVATAIVTKCSISDVCRWNHLGRNGTSNKLTHKKGHS